MDDRIMGMLLREVARLHLQMQRTSIACCGGTTSTQCFILTELGRTGPITLADLGRRLGLDKGWTSRAVDSMARQGLLQKEASATDRRTINISLTHFGEERYAELNRALNEQSGRLMRWIPEADQAVVYKALQVLEQALRAEAAGAAPSLKGESYDLELSFRTAVPADLPQILELLTNASLPLAGVEEHLAGFQLAFQDGSLAGCAGLERYGEIALLRSVAVIDGLRNTGLGTQLISKSLDNARASGTRSLVLLTTTASAYFERFGFETISRGEAPLPVQASVEFQGACPASATVMQLNLAGAKTTEPEHKVQVS